MSDYPDWFGQQHFPYYGLTIEKDGSIAVAPGETKIIVSYTGKGILYNAEILQWGAMSHKDDQVQMWIDNEDIEDFVFSGYTNRIAARGLIGVFFASYYNTVTGLYRVYLHGPIPFGLKVQLKYKNNTIVNANPDGWITCTQVI